MKEVWLSWKKLHISHKVWFGVVSQPSFIKYGQQTLVSWLIFQYRIFTIFIYQLICTSIIIWHYGWWKMMLHKVIDTSLTRRLFIYSASGTTFTATIVYYYHGIFIGSEYLTRLGYISILTITDDCLPKLPRCTIKATFFENVENRILFSILVVTKNHRGKAHWAFWWNESIQPSIFETLEDRWKIPMDCSTFQLDIIPLFTMQVNPWSSMQKM